MTHLIVNTILKWYIILYYILKIFILIYQIVKRTKKFNIHIYIQLYKAVYRLRVIDVDLI